MEDNEQVRTIIGMMLVMMIMLMMLTLMMLMTLMTMTAEESMLAYFYIIGIVGVLLTCSRKSLSRPGAIINVCASDAAGRSN